MVISLIFEYFSRLAMPMKYKQNVRKPAFLNNLNLLTTGAHTMRTISKTVLFALGLVILSAINARANDDIEDNSFLVEEAYNQEPGVVQFIFNYQSFKKSKDTNFSFTTEMPIGTQDHQFSFTAPYNSIDSTSVKGMGDLALNYRYQLLANEQIAMAPRISLLLPTGDYKKSLGTGSVGLQFNHTLSAKINSKLMSHWNIGFTYTPSYKEPTGATENTTGFNYGTSLVYLYSKTLNFMAEFVGNLNEKLTDPNTKTTENTFYFIPGVRYAINCESGMQIVPGIGAPIGFGPSERESAVFLYLSIENKLW